MADYGALEGETARFCCMIINEGLGGCHLPGWDSEASARLGHTQQSQTPCNPRAQEGHISSMEQEELSSVEIPLTSPIFLWETILLLTLFTMTLVKERVLAATAVRGTAYPLRSLPRTSCPLLSNPLSAIIVLFWRVYCRDLCIVCLPY